MTKDEAATYVKMFFPSVHATKVLGDGFAKEDFETHFPIDGEEGRYAYLARAIADWLSPFSVLLYVLSEYGIWQSRENVHLLQVLRASNGDVRPFFLAPAHIFMGHEREQLVSHLYLSLLFGWGGSLVSNTGLLSYTSHDGWVGLLGPQGELVRTAWEGDDT